MKENLKNRKALLKKIKLSREHIFFVSINNLDKKLRKVKSKKNAFNKAQHLIYNYTSHWCDLL